MGTGWYPRRLTADENERLVLPVSFVSFCSPRQRSAATGREGLCFLSRRYSTSNYGRLASWVTDGRTDGWVGGWGGWLAGVLSSRWPRCPYRDSCTPCVRGQPAASSLAAHLHAVTAVRGQYVCTVCMNGGGSPAGQARPGRERAPQHARSVVCSRPAARRERR